MRSIYRTLNELKFSEEIFQNWFNKKLEMEKFFLKTFDKKEQIEIDAFFVKKLLEYFEVDGVYLYSTGFVFKEEDGCEINKIYFLLKKAQDIDFDKENESKSENENDIVSYNYKMFTIDLSSFSWLSTVVCLKNVESFTIDEKEYEKLEKQSFQFNEFILNLTKIESELF